MRRQPTVKKPLTWWCVFGLLRVADRVWRTSQKQYLRLLPEAIGVTARGRSLRLERVLTDFGCEHSFIHAADRVREHYGFEISASAVREATFKHAQRAQDMLEQQYQEPFRILPSGGAQFVAERYLGGTPFSCMVNDSSLCSMVAAFLSIFPAGQCGLTS